METSEMQAKMWADLFTSEMSARSAGHTVTRRAEVFMAAGLPLETVLDALRISRATWYRRVEACRQWEAEGKTAGEAAEKRRAIEHQAAEVVGKAIKGD